MSTNYTQDDEVRYEDIDEDNLAEETKWEESDNDSAIALKLGQSRGMNEPRFEKPVTPVENGFKAPKPRESGNRTIIEKKQQNIIGENKNVSSPQPNSGRVVNPIRSENRDGSERLETHRNKTLLSGNVQTFPQKRNRLQRPHNTFGLPGTGGKANLTGKTHIQVNTIRSDNVEKDISRADFDYIEEIDHPGSEQQEKTNITVKLSAETTLPEWYILEEIIETFQPLPEGAIILGVDNFGKPLVLSLDDDSFGSMLFLGDDAGFNRKHLLSVLKSAEVLNQPDLLQIDVITPSIDSYRSNSSNLRKVSGVEDDGIFTILGDYLTEIEDRLRTDRRLPFQVLVLDQVETVASRLAEESLRFLRWIIRRGPQAGIWPLASLDSENLETFDVKTYKSFGFHLYGKMTKKETISKFTRVSPEVLKSLSPGSQGCFLIEKDLISFSIPELAN